MGKHTYEVISVPGRTGERVRVYPVTVRRLTPKPVPGTYAYSHFSGGTGVYRVVRTNRASVVVLPLGYLYTLGRNGLGKVELDRTPSTLPLRLPKRCIDGYFTRYLAVDAVGKPALAPRGSARG